MFEGKSQYWVSKKWQTQAEVQERQGLKSRADTKQLYKQANKHWETTSLETKTVCSGHCGLPACIWRFPCGSLDCMKCSWWGSTQTLTHLCPLQQLHKHTFTFRVLKGTWMKSFQNRDTTCFFCTLSQQREHFTMFYVTQGHGTRHYSDSVWLFWLWLLQMFVFSNCVSQDCIK